MVVSGCFICTAVTRASKEALLRTSLPVDGNDVFIACRTESYDYRRTVTVYGYTSKESHSDSNIYLPFHRGLILMNRICYFLSFKSGL